MLSKTMLLCSVIVLTACSSTGWKDDFSCPGMPSGVTCKSVTEVYKGTENADRMVTDEETQKGKPSASPVAPVFLPGKLASGRRMAQDALPILEPARVMRIWVAPWIDDRKDLHFPGYVFTEVTPRRWSMGEASAIRGKPLIPMQTEYQERPDEDGVGIGDATKVVNPKNLLPGKGSLERAFGGSGSNR